MKRIKLLFLIPAIFLLGFAAAKLQDEITSETLRHAGKLLGFSFNASHQEMMLDGVKNNLASYEAIRSTDLPNAVSPALYFNPLPVGFRIKEQAQGNQWYLPEDIGMPQNREDLAYYSIHELASLIKQSLISSEELTRFFIERLKKYGDTLECVVSITEERALRMARQADQELARGIWRGPLHGIPYGIKDLFSVPGYKTTWGAMPYKDQILEETATVVKKLDEAGAVLVAKLTLGSLAMGDVWYGGTTRNPWNLAQGSSGSSAGSAAAVSAGLVPFAIGTETLGSIVSPSTRCGVSGLRPTFGRVSRHGAMALSWSMDKAGPIARSALECALVFDFIRGSDGLDPTVIDAAFHASETMDVSRLRVGFIPAFFEADYPGKDLDAKVLEDLRSMGIDLKTADWPFELPVNALRIILSAEAAAAFDHLTISGRDSMLVAQRVNSWPNIFRTSRFIPAVEYINANRIRTRLIEQLNEWFKDYDVVVTPSYGGNQLLLTNLTGHPCMVVPSGFNNQGNPMSISFIGPLFAEAGLVALASAWQNYTSHHLKRPPLFDPSKQ